MSSPAKMKEINLVLLGETGVGKSTFINAFTNYLKFDNIREAKESELDMFIPMTLKLEDEDGKPVILSTGSSDNENYTKGADSVTVNAKPYEIVYRSYVLRLIDTPGGNETRGDENIDEVNINNTICRISQYSHINGILVLLKSDTNRLTKQLKLTLRSILSNLHVSAMQNVLFCLTNARTTDYKPGSARTTLQSFVKEEKLQIEISNKTLYCFDNEAVPYLIRVKNKFPCSDRESRVAEDSWDEAVKSTSNLMNTILRLTPHEMSQTASMSYAKRIIQHISRPLLTQARCIVNDKCLRITRYENPPGFLDKYYGVMLCTHAACTEVLDGEVRYTQVCHDQCWYRGSTFMCKSMRLIGGCTICQHNHECHEWSNIKYTIETDLEARDANSAYESMVKTAAKLSVFWRKNAIIETKEDDDVILKDVLKEMNILNDAIFKSSHNDKEKKTYAAYKKLLQLYNFELQQLSESGSHYQPAEVCDMIERLYKIAKYGDALKTAVLAAEYKVNNLGGPAHQRVLKYVARALHLPFI